MSELELRIVRVFESPIESVFQAWIKPEHLKRWACPTQFSIVEASGDARPGGKWRSVMRSPEGQDVTAVGEYLAVEPVSRIVMTHTWENSDFESPVTQVEIHFEPVPEGTRMTFVQTGFTRQSAREGHRDGWQGAFARLHALLGRSAESEIRDIFGQWASRIRADDRDHILSDFADDAVIFDVMGDVRYDDLRKFRSSWDELWPEHNNLSTFEITDLHVRISTELAVTTGILICQGTLDDGAAFEDQVRATFALAYQGGRWRIVHQHLSMVR